VLLATLKLLLQQLRAEQLGILQFRAELQRIGAGLGLRPLDWCRGWQPHRTWLQRWIH
jgi:hypothetical protein